MAMKMLFDSYRRYIPLAIWSITGLLLSWDTMLLTSKGYVDLHACGMVTSGSVTHSLIEECSNFTYSCGMVANWISHLLTSFTFFMFYLPSFAGASRMYSSMDEGTCFARKCKFPSHSTFGRVTCCLAWSDSPLKSSNCPNDQKMQPCVSPTPMRKDLLKVEINLNGRQAPAVLSLLHVSVAKVSVHHRSQQNLLTSFWNIQQVHNSKFSLWKDENNW